MKKYLLLALLLIPNLVLADRCSSNESEVNGDVLVAKLTINANH